MVSSSIQARGGPQTAHSPSAIMRSRYSLSSLPDIMPSSMCPGLMPGLADPLSPLATPFIPSPLFDPPKLL